MFRIKGKLSRIVVKYYQKMDVLVSRFLLTYEVCKTLRCVVYHYMTTKLNIVCFQIESRQNVACIGNLIKMDWPRNIFSCLIQTLTMIVVVV